jgi:SAM-dependent methyltransferase
MRYMELVDFTGATRNQQEYWDGCSTKTFSEPFNIELFQSQVSTYAPILDFGCGYGRISQHLHTHGYTHTVGVDFSEGMIERGKALHPHLDLRIQRELPLPFDDGHFDAVLLFTVLTCIANSDNQRKLVAEMRRVLRPGGILYMTDFFLGTDERNLARYAEYESRYDCYGVFELPDGGIFRHHTTDWIDDLMGDFVQLWTRTYKGESMNGNPARLFQYIGTHT